MYRDVSLLPAAHQLIAVQAMDHGRGTSAKPLKTLNHESHHPVIEIVKHTISPLSVALFIWFAGWSAVWHQIRSTRYLKQSSKQCFFITCACLVE